MSVSDAAISATLPTATIMDAPQRTTRIWAPLGTAALQGSSERARVVSPLPASYDSAPRMTKKVRPVKRPKSYDPRPAAVPGAGLGAAPRAVLAASTVSAKTSVTIPFAPPRRIISELAAAFEDEIEVVLMLVDEQGNPAGDSGGVLIEKLVRPKGTDEITVGCVGADFKPRRFPLKNILEVRTEPPF